MRLPYNGTEGYVDNPASKERAVTEALDGTVGNRQRMILNLLIQYGEVGATWGEVQLKLPHLHHGQISATLSVLHKACDVFQLKERRGKSHPYVHYLFRDCYTKEERIDLPARTKANDRADRLAKAYEKVECLQEILVLLEEEALRPNEHFFKVTNDTIKELIVLLEEKDDR